MAVRTKEEILQSIRDRLGEQIDSDESLALIEDVTDTIDSLNGDGTDWKQKYEDNDKEWRQRYRDRFFNSGTNPSDPMDTDPEPDPEPKKTKFEELFKEE